MKESASIAFLEHFKDLKDPRIDRKKLYPLEEVLLTTLCAVICGAECWRDMVLFGREKLEFLRQYLPFENGVPSKNTFARVYAHLDPESFKNCFIEWVKSFQTVLGNIIAIDGKTLRHSFDNAKEKPAIHMVSAFASQARLVLGQQKVDAKSNEITAIPKLLNLLDLKGAIVTIDAMGCQKSIVEIITQKGGDYVIALKGNQGTLHEDVALFLEKEITQDKVNSCCVLHEESDKGHGRVEIRKYWITEEINWLDNKEQWAGMKSIAVIESERIQNNSSSIERRFYISSLSADAQVLSSAVRSHWGVENNLHWVLDVTFGEDASRVRDKNAAENMAIIRHTALNLLQQAKKL